MTIGINYVGITTPFYCNNGEGKFLFHKRSISCRDEHGRWDPGSGELEFGQTPPENVLREVFEEYGCVGEIQEQLPAHSIFREWAGNKTHWLAIPFFVRIKPSEVTINEPHKIDDLGWFDLDSLPTPLHTGFQVTWKNYNKYFDKYRVKRSTAKAGAV